ncbi:MAG TPA: N-acetylglucosamine-6-phosphate deacetylase [Firmicutes bacterium]|jgi:N-acetylglucosamine-6-phosphate deacetylase|nr:N-acetylglucosamine-6-phosphate deacetylase [Bacillota bacterium]
MRHLIITNGTVVTDQLIERGTVVTIGGRIMLVAGEEEGRRILDAAPPQVFEVVDAEGGYIAPGFIDIHMHGCGGAELMDGTREALETMARFVASTGTVAFLPSTVTAEEEKTRRVCEAVASYTDIPDGAELLGVHLEGPYINAKFKGAQYGPAIREASIAELKELYGLLGEKLKLVTLAPEMPGSLDAVEWLTERGVTVSIGHSDAAYEEAVAGFQRGITHATHTFNAMRGLHHREPGAVGAVLATPGVYAELIADLLHVHPGAIKVMLRSVGVEYVVLVTDSMQATGLPDGEYVLGDNKVFVRDGAARLAEGNLAGSTLTMQRAVKNMVDVVGADLVDVFRMASLNPARSIGLSHRGWIKEGYKADFALLSKDLSVRKTVISGRVVFVAD